MIQVNITGESKPILKQERLRTIIPYQYIYTSTRHHQATFLLQPAWLPPLPSVDVTANLPGYIILSGYQIDAFLIFPQGRRAILQR